MVCPPVRGGIHVLKRVCLPVCGSSPVQADNHGLDFKYGLGLHLHPYFVYESSDGSA